MRNIRLSSKGRKLAPKVIAAYREFLHQMMASVLTVNEQRILTKLLKRLRMKTRDALGDIMEEG